MTRVKEIWMDVYHQVRLAVAEWLMNANLWIMPPGHEREQFAMMMFVYFKARELELKPIVLSAKARQLVKVRKS